MKRPRLWPHLFCCALALAGQPLTQMTQADAQRDAGAPVSSGVKLRFIFITTCVDEEFFLPVKKGMADAATLMNVDCTFTGTKGVDVKAQADMVRQAVKDGYDGIALSIIDPVGFDSVVAEAMQKGVPVVAFNVDDHATPNARMSAVCQNLSEAGKIIGKESARLIPEHSHVLMTMHDAGVSALEDRLHGAQSELKHKDITWTVAITGTSPAKAADVIAGELEKNPKIKFVIATGQADTEGAGLAVERKFGRQGVVAAGFDLSPEILRLVAGGHLKFTIDQQPYIQGFYPVVQLALYKRYGIKPSSMDAGAGIVSKEQAESVLKFTKDHYR
jgi:simple sugar transport system substrate-binding protein